MRRRSPQEGSVIRRILSEDALQSRLETTNPRKQLRSFSSSWVTVVIDPTNPLTHLLDRDLDLDSISWAWLGRDKRPLLRLWYPNERGSEAYVWFCLGVEIRDRGSLEERRLVSKHYWQWNVIQWLMMCNKHAYPCICSVQYAKEKKTGRVSSNHNLFTALLLQREHFSRLFLHIIPFDSYTQTRHSSFMAC